MALYSIKVPQCLIDSWREDCSIRFNEYVETFTYKTQNLNVKTYNLNDGCYTIDLYEYEGFEKDIMWLTLKGYEINRI
jgi:hypothetical protein